MTPERQEDNSPTLEGATLLIVASFGGVWIMLGLIAWWILK